MFGLSILAGAVVAAAPVTPAPWFTFDDYPMKAFEKNQEGVTQFELLISPTGKIAECKVTVSSGSEELDRTTCRLANKRAQFNPARGPDGQAVFGVYRSQALWAIPDNRITANIGPDLEVSVNQLPAGTTEPPVVKLAYAVDAQGKASGCTLMPSSLKQPAVLVELGCRELLSKAGVAPVVGPAGQPVPAVRTAAVRFNKGR